MALPRKKLFSLGHFLILLLRIVILFSGKQSEFNTHEEMTLLLGIGNEMFIPRKLYSFHFYQFSEYFCFTKVLGNHL